MIYDPAEDSFLLEEQVKKYSKNKSFLDVGSGSGIQAEAALNSSAKSITALEFDEESYNFLKKKFAKNKKVRVIKSNLFSKLNKKEIFDVITFNPPYLPLDEREPLDSRNTTTGGEKGDEIILEFLNQASAHLNKNGIILLLLSSLTPQSRIKILLKKLKLKYKKVAEKNIFMEKLFVWKINY